MLQDEYHAATDDGKSSVAAFFICAARPARLPFAVMALERRKTPAAAFLFLLAAAAFGQGAHQDARRLPVPGRAWALEISLPNFNVRHDALSADGRARRLYADIEVEGFIVTINIVPASTPKVSSKDLRDLAAERIKAGAAANSEGFRTSEYRQTPILEYFTREFKTQPVNQKHFYAYLSRDNVWIDIHLSKTAFREGDERLFYSILDTLRLTDSAGRTLDRQR